jgi:hypothetical protein
MPQNSLFTGENRSPIVGKRAIGLLNWAAS